MESVIITVDNLKELKGISKSTDADFLFPMIVQAQDLQCQNILGTALTVKLIADVTAGTLTGIYEELYNSSKASVKKMVASQAFYYNINRLWLRIGNSSISKGNEGIITASKEEIDDFKASELALMIGYENRVKTFLVENRSSISELDDTTPEFLQENTTASNNTSGFADVKTITYNNY